MLTVVADSLACCILCLGQFERAISYLKKFLLQQKQNESVVNREMLALDLEIYLVEFTMSGNLSEAIKVWIPILHTLQVKVLLKCIKLVL